MSKPIKKMLHNGNHHCGPQTLLAISRKQFRIVTAKNVANNCIRCTRSKPKLINQITGKLPPAESRQQDQLERVSILRPFWVHCKVRGRYPQKVNVVVFVCYLTKAVHPDGPHYWSLIEALKRFLARRGRCHIMFPDNATHFVAARNQLTEVN